MQLNTHLTFNGQCEAAFKFYEQLLGGKIITMMPYAGSPVAAHVSSDWQHKILHATLHLGDNDLMGCDAPPERFEQPKGFSVALNMSAPAHAERIFEALATNGMVRMPLQETFWAARFGMLVDQFGIPWMINCGKSA